MDEMANDTDKTTKGHSLRLDLDWRWHRPKRRPGLPKGEPRDDERPIRCIESGKILPATTTSLPYPDASCDQIDCGTVFAYVRNDEGLARELRRVVLPEGLIRIRVPSIGPIAVIDAFNLHRYLVDITGRGLRPFETADIGWRRHYGIADLDKMLDSMAFELIESRRYGIAASEAVRLSGFVLFRWLRPSRDRYRQMSRLAERILMVEERAESRIGYWLEATYRRK